MNTGNAAQRPGRGRTAKEPRHQAALVATFTAGSRHAAKITLDISTVITA